MSSEHEERPTPPAIEYSVTEGVATITLNRPDRLNALNAAMFEELMAAFGQTDANDAVRAVIVTGAGRAFCAGADLGRGAQTFDYGDQSGQPRPPRDRGGRLVLRIFRSLKPVIAAINGSAVGVGRSMTLPMDIRIVADHAKLGFVFAARGIGPDGAASWFLPRSSASARLWSGRSPAGSSRHPRRSRAASCVPCARLRRSYRPPARWPARSLLTSRPSPPSSLGS